MKLVSYEGSGGRGVAVERATGEFVATGFPDMLALIGAGVAGRDEARQAKDSGSLLRDVHVTAPIASPGKLLFCGINYRSHLDEAPTAVLPTTPFFFSKLPSAVVGPDQEIVCPAPDTQLDYEVELAAVIGREARRVSEQEALSYVFGYTVANDISARDVQFADSQITLGKGFDTFCPLGPAIVTTDEITDPQDLRLSTRVNGDVRQAASTQDQLFSVAFLVSFLSRRITLRPGDIVSTGTPAGVGTFRRPPAYLKPGDVVEVEVDAIGILRNRVVAGW